MTDTPTPTPNPEIAALAAGPTGQLVVSAYPTVEELIPAALQLGYDAHLQAVVAAAVADRHARRVAELERNVADLLELATEHPTDTAAVPADTDPGDSP